ncbi:hypothetical protein FIBSPDRAFT_1052962 [Athelia psychrophila]|uniref:Uncharacterized protein n=1 Tax=Athelia psychrophila TaxID=1759441 RepID=A0A167XPB0_9AGAM|nr:hypothetical protein FIBSPDRAFT_1052962 [Fibularhizoctonia sp. CBS 109695]
MSFTYAHLPPMQPVRPCDRPHARAVFAVSDNPSAYAVIRPVEAAVVDTPHGHMAISFNAVPARLRRHPK